MTTETKQHLIERLFKAGGHFGFQKSRRHPSVTQFLYGNKQGTDIIDLEQTADAVAKAVQAISHIASSGGDVLFVGTKGESLELVKALATEADAPYVANRWVGGTLTNFSEVRKRLNRLKDLVSQGESGELDRKYTKKERVLINREMQKLIFNFGGIRKTERLPKMMVVVDPRHNAIAVEEARTLNIPVVSISGSDNNIAPIQYPIVVNDSLVASVRTVLSELTAAYTKAKAEYIPPAQVIRAPRAEGDRAPRRFGRDRENTRRPFSARREGQHPRAPRADGGRPQAPRAPRSAA